MKKVIYSTLITMFFIVLISCQEKILIKERISNHGISLTFISDKTIKDSIAIIIPIEFQLNFNFPEVKDVGIYYVFNKNHKISQPQDYVIKNSQTNKIIFAIEDLDYKTYPKSIDIINRKVYISKNYANQLIKKYNPKVNINEIKTKNDTIKLISYSRFRNEQSVFLKEMRKIPDSVIFSIGKAHGKNIILKEKINW